MTKQTKAPIFCEKLCIICRGARAGNSLCKSLQNIELKITGPDGCPFGKARTKYYGVRPDQPIPK
ncbi:TPA: hypothetical protein HA351_07565 [Methanosarcinaceae archaeon]|nr:hypothetical protein [Methanosarcinaceae archaeon]